ncbi:hypothetical protein N431DRAFT_435543 [Stipitochalara longipes BDJ]|nr:hypothetical protein N431DRAFT_435543 [Stipitochalara longipes BDJ]
MSTPVKICSTEAGSAPTQAAYVLPDELKPYVTLLDEWALGLPVCTECKNAVLPKSLMDHLRKQHHLPVNVRAAVRSLVSLLPPLDITDLPTPPDGSAPLKALRVVEAFKCKHCPFIRQDLTDVRKHINKEHCITAAGSYEQIQAQSWLSGRRATYWRVERRADRLDWEGPGCIWGLFGKGFGDKTPRNWSREMVEKSLAA